jgi:hypothetical protein
MTRAIATCGMGMSMSPDSRTRRSMITSVLPEKNEVDKFAAWRMNLLLWSIIGQ